jgi:threonine/homoserine/homoserine lactone efflux protein
MKTLLAGLLLGLSAGLAPGPLLVLTLSRSLRGGPGEGLKVALAPLLTDLPIVAITLAGLAGALAHPALLGTLALTGGGYVFYLGVTGWAAPALTAPVPAAGAAGALWQGVLTNALSPHPYLFWALVGGPLVLQAAADGWWPAAGFVAGFYTALVGSKGVIALAAGHLRGWFAGPAYRVLSRLLGGLLILLGLALMLDAVRLLRDTPLNH